MPDPSGINPLVGRVAPPPEMPSFNDALGTQANYEQLTAYRKARIDAASDAAATQTALQQANGDPQAAIGHLMQSGKANAAGQLQKMWDAHLGEVEKQTDQHLKTQQAQATLISNMARAITDQHSFDAVKSIIDPKYLPVLGESYDPARIKALQDSTMTGEQLAIRQHQAFQDSLAAGTDQEKQFQSLLDFLGSAHDQASWEGALKYASMKPNAPKDRIATLPPQFSPEALKFVQDAAVNQETREKRPLLQAQTAEAEARAKAAPITAQADLLRAQTAANAAAPFAAGQAAPISTAPPEPTTGNIPKAEYGGLTPNSVYQGGISVALGGKNAMPNFGMGSSPVVNAKRNAILNQASAMATAAGVNQADLQQEYAGASAAVKKLTTNYALASAASTTANDNLDYALKLSPTVSRSDIPVANRLRQWWQAELGGASLPNLSAFETAIYTASREYAKVTSNAYASVAELSTAAAKKADELLNAAQQPAQFKAVTDVMRGDMGRVTAPMKAEIGSAKDIGPNLKKFTDFVSGGGKIGGEPPQTTQQPKAATGPKPPQGAKVDDLWQSPTGLMKFLGPGKGWGPG